MKVYIEKAGKTVNVKAKTVKELLENLEINPTTVLVNVNSELVTEDKKLSDNDEIKIHSVISGG